MSNGDDLREAFRLLDAYPHDELGLPRGDQAVQNTLDVLEDSGINSVGVDGVRSLVERVPALKLLRLAAAVRAELAPESGA